VQHQIEIHQQLFDQYYNLIHQLKVPYICKPYLYLFFLPCSLATQPGGSQALEAALHIGGTTLRARPPGGESATEPPAALRLHAPKKKAR
jgi:hypothetical protein